MTDDLYEHYKFIVPEGQSLLRIDKFLVSKIQNATRHKVQDGIKKQYVLVNGKSVKNNYRIKPDDLISIVLPQKPKDKTHYPEDIQLDIIFEDKYLIILNKVAGMVVHPAYNNYQGTLLNALLNYFEKNNLDTKPFIPHRIDKDTSGLMIIAKDKNTMKEIAKQFYIHSIDRTYYALVWGTLINKKGTINENLDRSLKNRKLVEVYKKGGKSAITNYEVVKEFKNLSLVKCTLETGRTHQIRVHLSYIGHPIFNDLFYGGNKIPKSFVSKSNEYETLFLKLKRHALHSKEISFFHPITNEHLNFEIELPSDFIEFIKELDKF